MKTKTWIFHTPYETEKVDAEINKFLAKHKVTYSSSDIVYDLGETYLFVVLAYNK